MKLERFPGTPEDSEKDTTEPHDEHIRTDTEVFYDTRMPKMLSGAKLNMDGEVPTSISSEFGTYEVVVKKETDTCSNFFAFEEERDGDGELVSIKFANPRARHYFETIFLPALSNARDNTASQLDDYLRMEDSNVIQRGESVTKEESTKPYNIFATLESMRSEKNYLALMSGQRYTPEAINELDLFEDDGRPTNRARELPLPDKRDNDRFYIMPDHFSYVAEDVLEMFSRLKQLDNSVVVHKMRVEIDGERYFLNSTFVGNINFQSPEVEYSTEQLFVDRLLFYKKTLGVNTIHSVNLYQNAIPHDRTDIGSWSPHAGQLLGNQGVRLNSTILLHPNLDVRTDYSDEEDKRVVHLSPNFIMYGISHEIAHALDSETLGNNEPAREGWARGVEYSFDYGISVRGLARHMDGTTKDVTLERLQEVLGNGDKSHLRVYELYDIPATLITYLYNKIGAENTYKFYQLLCGTNTPQVGARGILCRGNILASLANTCAMPNGDSPREFLEEFVTKLNQDLSKVSKSLNTERITSITAN